MGAPALMSMPDIMRLLLGAAANPPHLPMASTHMRNQLLEMHGWQVVSIPFNRWNRLSSLQEKQASWCMQPERRYRKHERCCLCENPILTEPSSVLCRRCAELPEEACS